MISAASVRNFLVGVAVAALGSGCGVRYVATSAAYELELLTKAEPVAVSLASGRLSAGQEQRLRLFAEVKAFGATLGLRATRNYSTYSRTWERRIWNLSAAPPLSFASHTWTFPIVGRVPYLGFFSDMDVAVERSKLEGEGYEVAVREVGAFSTLGWFRDPILPTMLTWDEARIAETVSHELAHATLWIPGSVDFNESFASVVGETAGGRYLVHKYGEGSEPVRDARDRDHDWRIFQMLLLGLYEDLDVLYRDPLLPDAEKLARKAALYGSLPDRVLASEIRQPARWARYAKERPWNNASLAQLRTYNHGDDDFTALLRHCAGDLRRFIPAVRAITRGARDPFAALHAAAGATACPAN